MAQKSDHRMSILSALKRPISLKAALQSWLGLPISLTNDDFWSGFFGRDSFTGASVSVDQTLKLSTAWACVRLISETQATLPFGFFKRNADGSRTPATEHSLYEILHNQPNADMTAAVFWEVVVASLLLWGNAYVEISRSGKTVVALQFLLPSCMSIRRLPSGAYEYRYRNTVTGLERVIPETNLMHIPAFSLDGIVGLAPIAYGANVFGGAIETDKASAQTFRDSLRSPGIITMNVSMKNEQREQLRAHIKSVSDSGGVMVVENGTGFEKLGFDPVSAELLASRSWNVEEIARFFRVDPAMIGHGGKDSNWGTGLEQKMIWFLTFTLRPWCVRIEQAVRRSLLSPAERTKYFAEFAFEGILRADSASRATFYSTMTQNGIYTRDECRVLENKAPMGGNAAVLTVQANMLPIDKLGQQPASPATPPATAQAVDDLRADVKALADRPLPATINNIDARTTVNQAPAEVTVNVPEQKAADVKVDVAAPVVNVAPAAVTVNIEAASGEQTTTYEHDPETKEIVSSTTKRK